MESKKISISFNPFPVKGERNCFHIFSEQVVILKFEGHNPVTINTQECDISQFYNKNDSIVRFSMVSPIEQKYILKQVDYTCWTEKKQALYCIHKEVQRKTCDTIMLSLLAEYCIYASRNINCFDRKFFESTEKLLDQEIECLRKVIEKEERLHWFVNLTKRFQDNTNILKSQNMNWLWIKGTPSYRFLHFVTSDIAIKLLENETIPIGMFIVRPSFKNAGHIALTYKCAQGIEHGLFEHPSVVKASIVSDQKLKYALAIDLKQTSDKIRYTGKEALCNESGRLCIYVERK